ncbi:MAG TPA: tRNA 5-methoxyuridine(34)/uridine 5-oxyacetic acid(34) synthase CmoB [Oligoflexia bacterium]|nr:tRNA 5-methoxyuridine(34)/uridine 5-oxyacetic acid(34) synthase CmoB [Oligoflexia bacterium]HMP47690.1 tRNA 5-methoxyuridine(34)/uridine 5-oxyacetic acid(34) synthase CmoB [Oligoflexia bacterium]
MNASNCTSYIARIVGEESPLEIHSAFFEREDLLNYLVGTRLHSSLLSQRKRVFSLLMRPVWKDIISLLSNLGSNSIEGYHVDQIGRLVTNFSFGLEGEKIQAKLRDNLILCLKHLIPWRKGPFCIGGVNIDAEWDSNIKYSELKSVIKYFSGASILDIGGGNGYYAFRMRKDGAKSVISLDPSEKFFYQFELFQKFAKDPYTQYEPLSFEYAGMLGHKFDIVSCMGVIYHQKNPLYLLECCKEALNRKKGTLILESMVLDSNKNESFFPPGRYAKARNVFFIPSVLALNAMCQRAGFRKIELISMRYVGLEEQARREYAPYESLSDFLDPIDRSKTIEGYPAPARAIIVASL